MLPGPASADHHPRPTRLKDRAVEDLRFIRETMASATRYTAFSGKGLIVVACGAIGAGLLASRTGSEALRSRIWLADAGVSLAVGVLFGLEKARSSQQSMTSGPVRKFTLSFAPAILAGGLVTLALLRANATALLPGTWLSLYGAAVIAAGTSSVLAVPVMGVGFLILGAVGLLGPAAWGNGLMMTGFGALQLVVGLFIARRHGG